MNPLWTRIHLIYHDLSDLRSLILIRIILKESTLRFSVPLCFSKRRCYKENIDMLITLRA